MVKLRSLSKQTFHMLSYKKFSSFIMQFVHGKQAISEVTLYTLNGSRCIQINGKLKDKEILRQIVNLQDAMEGLEDSRHSLEQELVSPLDDETCRQRQTYSLRSSYRTGIQVGQASQETHSPSALYKDSQKQHQIDKMETLEILKAFHFGDRYCKLEKLLESVAGFQEMKQN